MWQVVVRGGLFLGGLIGGVFGGGGGMGVGGLRVGGVGEWAGDFEGMVLQGV